MIANPATKYQPIAPVALTDRQWPSRSISRAPVWLSTDLRDGNQALFEPMNCERKLRLFHELVRIGFKEIEVGFPAASQTDFDCVRRLVDDDLIPDDVRIMVITQLREDLIARTVQAVRGARHAIVHLYNATAPAWRRTVFGMNVAQMLQLIRHHVGYLRQLTDAQPATRWTLQYSPETFSATEPDVSLRACQTAISAWGTGPDRRIIINLPSTVENATPNVFADQIEWMHRRLSPREHVLLSVHPHNDRGTGVAAAELAMMAGAQRVEGCLFGNGERCGNVDIVTLALNLYTQGVSPGLDFSDITAVARVAEECTALPVHPRHPYAGDLVFTAFSGSHQDAIRKGLAAQDPDAAWAVPYLPIDPADLGRTYDGVIRVNSQSGKGGIAFLLERGYGVVMPRRMQVEFSALVQRQTDASETEMGGDALWELFRATYLQAPAQPAIVCHSHRPGADGQGMELDVSIGGARERLRGQGCGPVAATVDALGLPLRVDHCEERAAGVQTMVIVEAALEGVAGSTFGAGASHCSVTASVQALVNAANRLMQRRRSAPAARAA
ncbi:2-isopropylmalate synthase [Verminephrobacter aporrectodeae subsp. tuberculatae]|uniref:2-isopropylmalate synthase n=1 Tax=Verminephrobacter aporrectodeae TaxID=1110389 RepID=UPI002244508C|nr:2-isopropylmalate synthase [Verminephrobacter aporrectodeae]MCW8163530.1 2-isopropylmalate synthase [Verminephrobacter aporrectodeae subsp. tuberculatae]MCW8167749.1 2-isopropylmalate synthase [Verminephrobacter aporrectodeae subsp. tuberculatae]